MRDLGIVQNIPWSMWDVLSFQVVDSGLGMGFIMSKSMIKSYVIETRCFVPGSRYPRTLLDMVLSWNF